MSDEPRVARDHEELSKIGTAERPFREGDQEQPWWSYDPPDHQVSTSFGGLRALVAQVDVIHRQAGNPDVPRHDTVPGQGPARDALDYFNRLMVRMPGFEAFVACLRRHGRDLTTETTDWVRQTLADQLRGQRDPDGLTLDEVTALLDQPEVLTLPPAPEHPPKTLDDQAVGWALALLRTEGRINVSKIAKLLGCSRRKLSRLPRFSAALAFDRSNKPSRPRGTKDWETGQIEAWEEDN
jgi:hypothetical protein